MGNLGILMILIIVIIFVVSILFFVLRGLGVNKAGIRVYVNILGVILIGFFGMFSIEKVGQEQIKREEQVKESLEEAEIYTEYDLNRIVLKGIDYGLSKDSVDAEVLFILDGELVEGDTKKEGQVHFKEGVEEPYIKYRVVDREISGRYKQGDVYGMDLYLPKDYEIESAKKGSTWVIPMPIRR